MSAKNKKEKKTGAERFADLSEWVNPTPEGALKDFSEPMESEYHPRKVESAWQAYWTKLGLFTPDADKAKAAADDDKFVMVIPPPNVTGTLHIGHALMASIEDCVTRWHRMQGKQTLWLPGSDHAGIATQSVVEKQLHRAEGKTRHDLGREEFLKRCWSWTEEKGGRIFSQLSMLGCSLDMTRERFTLDPGLSRAVTEAFVRMHEKGAIYRADRLVNWSCALSTAISDIEIDHREFDGPTLVRVPGHEEPVEVGVMHSLAYKVEGGGGEEIVISTTRLETMLGDVAVAVHPDDDRYRHLVGKRLTHPFAADRGMVVVADADLVDPEFGTGAVKITPAHDPNDYECGKRHGLPFVSILDEDGLVNAAGGAFAGQPRFVARRGVEEALKRLGLYRGKEPNPMRIGFCSRSKDLIEPVLRPQWYVDTTEMAARAVKAVEDGDLRLVPEAYNDVWYHWLREARPWCISRQLVWGHQIPAWCAEVDGEEHWVVARDDAEAAAKAAQRWPNRAEPVRLVRDDDVLDTWFSSGLFPFATMGWPDRTDDLDAFFPGTLLETGSDILFFWVARMVMMSLDLCDVLPFRTVYLHSMVRDKTGDKMSKSKGNVIDPLDMISGCTLEHLQETVRAGNLEESELEKAFALQLKLFPHGIAECGADALRFGLLRETKNGRDSSVNLDASVVTSFRQFCNKLWQVTRFAFLKFPAGFRPAPDADVRALRLDDCTLVDRWILHCLHGAVRDTNAQLAAYDFSGATHTLYRFWYDQLCSTYVEAIKPRLQAGATGSLTVLYTCLDYGLRLLHPIMPFVTEELYHRLQCLGAEGGAPAGGLRPAAAARYPLPADSAAWESEAVAEGMGLAQVLAGHARSTLSSLGISADPRPLTFHFRDAARAELASRYAADLGTLCGVPSVTVASAGEDAPAGCLPSVVDAGCTLFVPAHGLEASLAEQLRKQEKKLVQAEASLSQLERQAASPNYAKAPEATRAKNAQRMEDLRAQVAEMMGSMDVVAALMSPAAADAYAAERAGRVRAEAAKADDAAAALEKKLVEPKKPLDDKQKAKLLAQIEEKKAIAAALRAKADKIHA